jgi:GAF domain-containing protein
MKSSCRNFRTLPGALPRPNPSWRVSPSGPFAGSFTPNARIPLNTGLCGAAASSGQTVVVDDVSKDPRYLAGSPLVKCEIVVPIFVKNTLVAELDVESYFASTFTKGEQEFVEACAAVVGKYLGKR